MLKATVPPVLFVTVSSKVPGVRPAGSVATICVLLNVETASATPSNETVGLVLAGSKPVPVSVIWLVE
jgi:hypothetical protein